MSSLVTFSSGTRMRKPEVGFGVVGTNTQTTFSFIFCCTSSCCSLVMKANGIHAFAREFHEHDGFERTFFAGYERLVDLPDGAVKFVQQRHVHQQRGPSIRYLFADVIPRQHAHHAEISDRRQQQRHADSNTSTSGHRRHFKMRDGHLGRKNKQRVRDAGDRAEQPLDRRQRESNAGRDDRQSGQKTATASGQTNFSVPCAKSRVASEFAQGKAAGEFAQQAVFLTFHFAPRAGAQIIVAEQVQNAVNKVAH